MIYLFQILNGIGLGMLYFLLAVGLSVIFGLLQFVNFAHGAFYLLGAYLTFDLTQRGFSFWAAMPMATLIVAGIAAAIEALLLHRIYKLPHTFHILVTVGLALAALAALSVQLRMGRTIGFSLAVLWGLVALAAGALVTLRLVKTPSVCASALIASEICAFGTDALDQPDGLVT